MPLGCGQVFQRSLRVHCRILVPGILLFWTETSDVVLKTCWSCSPSLWVAAPSAPITAGTTAAFTPHISSFRSWYFSSFLSSFFRYTYQHCLLLLFVELHNVRLVSHHQFGSLDLEVPQDYIKQLDG